MRRLGALCLCLGLTAPAFADSPPAADETPSIPWYRWLFLGERAPAKPTQKRDDAPAARATAQSAAPKESPRDLAAKQLEQEQRVYLQRTQAIVRIRNLAAEQNDEKMLKKADELEQQAFELYQQRTAGLMAIAEKEDRAALERGKDDRPATADRSRRRTTGGMDR
jgi:hypothetical protein